MRLRIKRRQKIKSSHSEDTSQLNPSTFWELSHRTSSQSPCECYRVGDQNWKLPFPSLNSLCFRCIIGYSFAKNAQLRMVNSHPGHRKTWRAVVELHVRGWCIVSRWERLVSMRRADQERRALQWAHQYSMSPVNQHSADPCAHVCAHPLHSQVTHREVKDNRTTTWQELWETSQSKWMKAGSGLELDNSSH